MSLRAHHPNTALSVLLPSLPSLPHSLQAYLLTSLGLTGAAMLFNKNQWPEWLLLDWSKVFTRLQVGREGGREGGRERERNESS